MAVWARARATLGEAFRRTGPRLMKARPCCGSSRRCRPPRRRVVGRGPSSDAYAFVNDRHAGALGGAAALLDRRLRSEIDRSVAVVTAGGRRDLDDVRQWVENAAAAVPRTPGGRTGALPVISRGSGEVAEILQRSQADMNAIAGRIQGIGAEYQALGNEFKLGNGDGAAPGAEPGEEPPTRCRRRERAMDYPVDPPPPVNSAPGGGRWELGQAYPPGPGGGPPMGADPGAEALASQYRSAGEGEVVRAWRMSFHHRPTVSA